MIHPTPSDSEAPPPALDALDRLAIGYVALPLVIFIIGWLRWWVALPLLFCTAYALRALRAGTPAASARSSVTPVQIALAVGAGCVWTLFGGAHHLMFANADWFVRDAVLHDMVVSPWPVGYGILDGQATLLRTSAGFYLIPALLGKVLGLSGAHWAMAAWTASGASLFLLQVLSLVPARGKSMLTALAVVIFFSGFDVIGSMLNYGPRFFAFWNIAKHLEWWALRYQYSSMTTQLFWVPNHAIAAWLLIGMLFRNVRLSALEMTLPMLLAAAALWSPLSAVGAVPFVAWRVGRRMLVEKHWELAHPRVWLPALIVGAVVASYLVLDPGRIPKGVAAGPADGIDEFINKVQFFMLEAGFIGLGVLVLRPSAELVLALVILALLPLLYLGPANDLVMRASIPSLAILAIGACLALTQTSAVAHARGKKILLGCMLIVGAVTPIQEFARAAILPAWPIDTQVTLIGTNCGRYPAHYVARLGAGPISFLLRDPHALDVGRTDKKACDNPALELMLRRGLLID